MKTTTKTGRKIVGALVSAAVMFSMIPAMVFADDAPTTVDYDTKPIEIGAVDMNGSGTFDGVDVALSGKAHIKTPSGFDGPLFKIKDSATDYVFSLNPRGEFADAQLLGVIITLGGVYVQNQNETYTPYEGDANFDFTIGDDFELVGNTLTFMSDTPVDAVTFSASETSMYDKLYVEVTGVEIIYQIPATDLAISPDSIELLEGETATITATVTPENSTYNVVWTSDDPSVATVNNDGVVTGVAGGMTVIRATVGHGEDAIVRTCEVAVIALGPDVSEARFRLAISIATIDGLIENYSDYIPADLLAIMDEASDLAWEVYLDPEATDDILNDASDMLGELINEALKYIVDGGDDTVYYTEEQLRQMSVNNFVENLYLTILNRQFDAAGRDSWLNCLMQQGGTATEVVIGFLKSPEYTSYNVSNEEFVATCYRVFCNRAATAAETASWVAQLEGGTSRDTVISQFAQSPEWANICAFFKVNV